MALTLEEFQRMVASVGKLAVETVRPEARLIEDLGLDSLQIVELMASLADAGAAQPEDVAYEGGTVADGFRRATAVMPGTPVRPL